ncbi:MAG: serine/threonine-protein kinase [Planctomycetota bacterium]|nr:serine/threonine-protein kinase [Planctomycetota bacterium]
MPQKPFEAESRVHRIVDAVLDLPESQRGPAIVALCGGDAKLEAAVRRAVAPDEQADLELALSGVVRTTPTLDEPMSGPSKFGPYYILERLGEGAFGEVYVAEQTEPVRRKVAVKVLKAGMGSRQVIARFEAERQALAIMDHPSIARIFDAGETPLGLPYFVMELVRGKAITAYCNENRLGLRERLALLVPVCQAVQHAHQRGIIHRDIKPSNILVTILDGKAMPKVIDFGIAKALGPTLTDATIYTQFRQFIGTPAYMSPEQMALSAVDVDTRSDVYSLGALLYELVCGSPPIDAETLLRAGLDELRRVVRETDPPTPSSRVGSCDAPSRTALASAMQIPADRLTTQLQGEVDWIVSKATERDRARRYQSPSELASDIEAYLAGAAVKAGPRSRVYMARKFARKHRVPLAIGGVLAMGLIATTIATSIGLSREAAARADAVRNERAALDNEKAARESAAAAQVERLRAEKNARIATAAMNFLPSVLEAADPAAEGGRRDVTVAEMLDRAMAAADTGIDSQGRAIEPEVVLQSRLTAANLYFWQGRSAEGFEQASKAMALAEATFGQNSLETAQALGAVVSGHWFSARPVRDLSEGERLARRRLALLKSLGHEQSAEYADALHGLGLMLHAQYKSAACVELYQQLVEIYDALPDPPPLGLATAHMDIALNLTGLGRADEAVTSARRGIMIHERVIQPRAGDRFLARPYAVLASALTGVERYEEAEAAARRSMEIHDRLRGSDHIYPQFERKVLIWTLLHQGKFEQALPLIQRYDQISKAGGSPPGLEEVTRDAFIARRTGQHQRALQMWLFAERTAFEGPKPLFSKGDPAVAFGFGEFLGVLTDLGQPRDGLAKAVPVYDAVRETLRGSGHDSPTNSALRRLAAELLRAYEALGDAPSLQAARVLRDRYPGLVPAPGSEPKPAP